VKPVLCIPVEQEVRALTTSQPKEHLEAVERTHGVDWANLTLPDTWPDQLNLRNPVSIARLLTYLFRKRQKVVIPRDLPGVEGIPEYVLQEFHNLPNGNYSDVLTRGYITGFDASMLGQMRGCVLILLSAWRPVTRFWISDVPVAKLLARSTPTV
jgi:hypothetical protein